MWTIVVVDILWTLALLGLAKRMQGTRVASATLLFGLLFLVFGAITFGGMTEAGAYLMSGIELNAATKAEITRAIETLTGWRDFIWHTQVIIGAVLIVHWVTE
jgi:predicted membrane channel-forming protein YqfA (hemolysin III family)